jgi:glycosyltransferase involved in cell wall biosynthesis
MRRAAPWIRDMPKFVLGNGIASEELARLPERGRFRAAHPELAGRPMILFLSRLHPKKGLDRLIPAWKQFAERMPEARLVIAGSGEADYIAALNRLIARNGLAEKIVRVGQLPGGPGGPKWEALVDADLFVLPSHQEGFSMAITEALAAGCVPVVTAECNFDELTTSGCGAIISNGDMDAFVTTVAQLLTSDDRRRSMAAAGQKLVRDRFTWEKIAEDLERIYLWIRAGRSLPPDGADVWRPASI